MLKHPLPMKTIFRHCYLVNFAVEPEALQRLLPSPLEVDQHEGKAYVSIVLANMEKMRPAFLPRIFGVTYNQVVYRAVVRCQGKRGVFFLRSDADNCLMVWLGDALTFFRFHYSRIRWELMGEGEGEARIRLESEPSGRADIRAHFISSANPRTLPGSSRFADAKAAKDFLVELYSAFAVDSKGRPTEVKIERTDWELWQVEDQTAFYPFMQGEGPFKAGEAVIDSIFYVRDLPYHWLALQR